MSYQTKRALVAAFANPSCSPRPRRMIECAIASGYQTSLYTLPPGSKFDSEATYPIHKKKISWKWRRKFAAVALGIGFHIISSQSARESLINAAFGLGKNSKPFQNQKYDIIIVEDLFLLQYCIKHSEGASVVFDAREFYPKQREGEFLFECLERPIRDWFCKTYLPLCQKIYTVSGGLANAYKIEYGVTAEVLRSTPPRTEFKARVDEDISKMIRIIHIGVANPNRKIENMIKIFSQLKKGFSFDVYLTGNKPYIIKLKRLARKVEGLRILPPVTPSQIIDTLRSYDICFCYFEPTTFNLKHCLPNKFFESIQARVALAIGPSPDMAEIVDKYGCGFVAKEFRIESMVKTLNAQDQNTIKRAKQACDHAANELCAEKEWAKLINYLQEAKRMNASCCDIKT